MTAVADLKKKKEAFTVLSRSEHFYFTEARGFFSENDDCFHDRLHGFSYIDSIRWWSVSNV